MAGRSIAVCVGLGVLATAFGCTQRNPFYGLGAVARDGAVETAAEVGGDAAVADLGGDSADDVPQAPADTASSDGNGVDVVSVIDLPVELPLDTAASPRLVGYWRFDETSGTVAEDASRYGHHGTLEKLGARPWTTGRVGGAIDFPAGKLGQGVRVPITPVLDGLRAFTVVAWVLPRQTGPGPLWAVISRQRAADNDELFDLTISDDELIIFLPRGIDGLRTEARSDDKIEVGQWNHVAATYDGRTIRLFADGVEVANAGNVNDRLASATTPLYIGANKNAMLDSDLDDEPFEGLIDEVAIFSYALAPADIKAIRDGASVFAY